MSLSVDSPENLLPAQRSAYALPLWIWIGAIVLVSSVPGPTLERVPVGIQDKLAHLVEYGVLGFLAYRYHRVAMRRNVVLAILIAWLVAFCVGGLDELYQALIPGRDCDWVDWMADQVGGLAGGIVCALYLRWIPRSTRAEGR